MTATTEMLVQAANEGHNAADLAEQQVRDALNRERASRVAQGEADETREEFNARVDSAVAVARQPGDDRCRAALAELTR